MGIYRQTKSPIRNSTQQVRASRLHFGGHLEAAPTGYCREYPFTPRSRSAMLRLQNFMAIVSITLLRVRSWQYLVPFLFYALRSFRQAGHSQENLAASLLRDSTFWTRTVWTTESAMKDFVLAGAHRQVMRRLLEWCNEAALVHWEHENKLEPDWHDAQRRLQMKGDARKSTTPSPAHESFRIRPRRVRTRIQFGQRVPWGFIVK